MPKSKRFKKRFWTNLSWLKDDENPIETYLYKTEGECRAILPEGDELALIEITEIRSKP